MIFVDRYNRAGWAKDAEAYVPSAIDYYITPEIRETAMQLLSKSRKAANGSLLGGIPQVCVVDEGVEPVYIHEEDEEKAMKLLEKDDGYPQAFDPAVIAAGEATTSYVTPRAKEEAMKLVSKPDEGLVGLVRRVVGPTIQQTTSEYPIPDKTRNDMELHAKTEQDEYNKKPKIVNGANPQFLVVRYGWYAFAFLLEEGDVRGPELNAKAIQICEAMLTLESGDEQKYMSGLDEAKAFAKRDRQKRKAGRTTR